MKQSQLIKMLFPKMPKLETSDEDSGYQSNASKSPSYPHDHELHLHDGIFFFFFWLDCFNHQNIFIL